LPACLRDLNFWLRVAIVFGVSILAWSILHQASAAGDQVTPGQPSGATSAIFTPAHRTTLGAVQEFFGWRPTPIQPIAFTHTVHLAKGMQCAFCHLGVDRGPDAMLPSTTFCMTCHVVIAKDQPEIKKLAAYKARGEDVPWQRVYGFEPSAHVRFNHAPHVRAGINCAQCHGDMTKQTVAVRMVDHTMAFCVQCHKQQNVSVDCVTCHF
jgi:hypothetical protein